MAGQRERFAIISCALDLRSYCQAAKSFQSVSKKTGLEGHLDFTQMEEYLAAHLQAQLEDDGLPYKGASSV